MTSDSLSANQYSSGVSALALSGGIISKRTIAAYAGLHNSEPPPPIPLLLILSAQSVN